MKCLLTHHTASCFKFFPLGIFTSKAPSNKPLHKRCSSVHFAAFTHLLLQPGKIRNFGITSAKTTSYLSCSRVSTCLQTSWPTACDQFPSDMYAMFQNTLKVNPLFSNILSCKVLWLSSKYFCPTVFCTFSMSKTYHQETTRDM